MSVYAAFRVSALLLSAPLALAEAATGACDTGDVCNDDSSVLMQSLLSRNSNMRNGGDYPQCDSSMCRGCSGSVCATCQEAMQVGCCLEVKCSGCGGEQCGYCKADRLSECCNGISEAVGVCRGRGGQGQGGTWPSQGQGGTWPSHGQGGTGPTASCDDSKCRGCQGTACITCRQEVQVECCLNSRCHGCGGEQCEYCHQQHTTSCCAGISEAVGRCRRGETGATRCCYNGGGCNDDDHWCSRAKANCDSCGGRFG